jgi:hypothetical protein
LRSCSLAERILRAHATRDRAEAMRAHELKAEIRRRFASRLRSLARFKRNDL